MSTIDVAANPALRRTPAATPSVRAQRTVPSPSDLLPAAPAVGRRAAVVAAAIRSTVPRLDVALEVALPDGEVVRARRRQERAPRLTVHDQELFARLARRGKLGLGESYMAGEWSADDLPGVLSALADATDRVPTALWRAARSAAGHLGAAPPNTPSGAAENIRHHYDLSNELFALFLDGSMTYSSAVFAPGDTLEDAQARKRALLLSDLGVGPGDHLLEIGTGWGAVAIDAARAGCRVTTVTLSREQADHARAAVAAAGLDDRVEVLVADYRELEGRYDAVVSVEMLEAVGERWWPAYFTTVHELLAPGGRAAIQTITMTHDRWLAARGGYGWIHRYIFPGGEIPSLAALHGPVTGAGLELASQREIGDSYAETLRRWRGRFLDRLPEVDRLGFDATFVRMWEFYLAYCEAGFRTRRLGTSQLLLVRS